MVSRNGYNGQNVLLLWSMKWNEIEMKWNEIVMSWSVCTDKSIHWSKTHCDNLINHFSLTSGHLCPNRCFFATEAATASVLQNWSSVSVPGTSELRMISIFSETLGCRPAICQNWAPLQWLGTSFGDSFYALYLIVPYFLFIPKLWNYSLRYFYS